MSTVLLNPGQWSQSLISCVVIFYFTRLSWPAIPGFSLVYSGFLYLLDKTNLLQDVSEFFHQRKAIASKDEQKKRVLIISIRKPVLEKSEIKVIKTESSHVRQTSGDNRKDSVNPFGTSWKILVHKSFLRLIILCFTDADECADGSHDCDVNADCNNIAGSYTCSCKPTYFGNGKYCTSFREFYVCHISSDCIN